MPLLASSSGFCAEKHSLIAPKMSEVTIKEEQLSDSETLDESTPSTERPIRINGGEILNKFNSALASIITTSSRSSQATPEEKEKLAMATQKSPKLAPPVWYSNSATRPPALAQVFSPIYQQYAFIHQTADTPIRPIHDPSLSVQRAVDEFDEFNEWIDGSCKLRYSAYSREAQAHISGWAMKYTNNHNKYVLKKTCVGVLLCSKDCTLPNGLKIVVRPAISDKVRERQIGQNCPNASCSGILSHRKCTGNNGYPVTHFWVHQDDGIYFESKGTHDHFRPQARRATPDRSANRTRHLSSKEEGTNSDEPEERGASEAEGATSATKPPQGTRRGRKRKHPDRFLPVQKLSSSLSHASELLRGFSIDEEDQYVCVTLPETEHLIQRALLSHEQSPIAPYGRLYLLCQTFKDVTPGFNLLETRIICHEVSGWPVVMATLYKQGTREGIVQHMKTMARLCSSPREEIFSPKWQMVIHDFTPEQAQLAIEAIVNMIINSQVQTLLRVFQYKSVSSLYKMLREKVTSSMQSYESHFELCRREILSRLQDPLLTMKFGDTMKRLTSDKCSVQEFVSADCLLSGGILGSVIREFWNFWGSSLVASKVFPVAASVRAHSERLDIWRKVYTELEWPLEHSGISLQAMSDVVFRWIKCHREFFPKAALREMTNLNSGLPLTRLSAEQRLQMLRSGRERLGSAFHRPLSCRTIYMPRMHWM
ncbi:uncharacterized protein LOC5504408 isoform X2 [Nematostella vectensis]|uniref:uncharacterized protein LOC5504408 isoform X2 n=1 Tax=Nematostella vectensis TaxID=45351 RepID=UPI00207779C1|nr:uncharacterized protein LOC5504408 isoform X2 [Nematostella vectensis]